MIAALLTCVIGAISVADHGALPDDGVNDRTAIEAALAAGVAAEDDVHFPTGTYEVSGEGVSGQMILVGATERLVITADPGARLVASCDDEGEHEVMLVVGSPVHGFEIHGLELDANHCAARVFEALMPDGNADDTGALLGVNFHGGRQSAGASNAAGAHVRGGFPELYFRNSRFADIGVTEPCGGAVFARGLEVVPYCGVTDYSAVDVVVDNVTIADITDGGCNSDGFTIQTHCGGGGDTFPVGGSWAVTNSRFENCEYRSIKSQAIAGTVADSVFVRNAYNGHHEIDCQYSDCTIERNTFLSDTFTASSVAGAAIRDVATTSFFDVHDNVVTYAGVVGTFPFQVYDLTTAGGDLVDVYIRRNEVRGEVTSLAFADAPFAGSHLVVAEHNKACGAPVVLTEPDEDVGLTDTCNKVGC